MSARVKGKRRGKDEGEGGEAVRLLKVLIALRGKPRLVASVLAAELGVDPRSIFRYVAKLRQAGLNIEADRKLGYRLSGESFLPPLQLSTEEALALMAMGQSAATWEQMSMLGPLERAMTKVSEQLPAQIRQEAKGAMDHMFIQSAAASDATMVLDVYARVKRGIAEKRVLTCEYDRRGGRQSKFHLQPYALYFGVRAWYVIGRHIEKQSVRTLRLSRFAKVDLTDEEFEVAKGFSVEEHFGNAWVMVKGERRWAVELMFSPALAETISETRWHKTQEVELLASGELRFTCSVDGLDEIVWWVMSMGASCRVVKPAALQKRVREQAAKIAGLYGKDGVKELKDEEWGREPGEGGEV